MFDLFVTHDWREHDERDRVLQAIDQVLGLNWRNYGNPWYDPAVPFMSPEGIAHLTERLESQISPSCAVIFVPSIYAKSQRGKTWVGLALERARYYRLPVLGVSQSSHPQDSAIVNLADRWVDCDGTRIVSTLKDLQKDLNL